MSIRASHCLPGLGNSHSAASGITYFWRWGWAAGIAVNFFLQLLLAVALQWGWWFE